MIASVCGTVWSWRSRTGITRTWRASGRFIVDPLAKEHWETVANSIGFWNKMGAGHWTGWCVPWASILCSRLGLADAAVTWLHWMLDNFTNVGWGTLHNADFAGTSALHDGSLLSRAKPENAEVMQMDATMDSSAPSPNCWCVTATTASTF